MMTVDSRSCRDVISSSTTPFYSKIIVYILVMIFGLGTWTSISGLWVESPIMVPILPESWQLPAKLNVLICSANMFPIALVFASIIFKLNTAPFEVPVNFALLSVSITMSIAFAFLWDKTGYFFGIEQSIYLMGLCFFTAIADCMSSTTFIPFLHRYEPIYLNAYFGGEALTAFLPALLGIAQGIGTVDCIQIGNDANGTLTEVYQPSRFSVRTYFLILTCLPFSSLLAFLMLNLIKIGRSNVKPPAKSSKHHESRIFILMESIEDLSIIQNTIETINKIEDLFKKNEKKHSFKSFALSQTGIYLWITFQTSLMLYGICSGLTTFSLNAYSAATFHYTIIASTFAYPIMSIVGAFVPEVSSKSMGFLFLINIGLFVYIFITAKLSPCPPLVDTMLGNIIVFSVWVLIFITGSYIRILMGNYFRKTRDHRGLVWFGLSTQIGSMIGSVIVFILANNLQIFKRRYICDRTSKCF